MMDAAKIREALENAIDIDGPGAQDSDIRSIRALLDSGFLESAMAYCSNIGGDFLSLAHGPEMMSAYRRLTEKP